MRKAIESDLVSITSLCEGFKATENYKGHTLDEKYIYRNLLGCYNNPLVDLLVYVRANKMLGAACGMEHQTLLCPDKEYSELFVICSDPRGVLSLLNGLEDCARVRQVERMGIGSSTGYNPRYWKLLEKRGFSPLGRSFRKVL
jgi:hypothetical protein